MPILLITIINNTMNFSQLNRNSKSSPEYNFTHQDNLITYNDNNDFTKDDEILFGFGMSGSQLYKIFEINETTLCELRKNWITTDKNSIFMQKFEKDYYLFYKDRKFSNETMIIKKLVNYQGFLEENVFCFWINRCYLWIKKTDFERFQSIFKFELRIS